MAYLGLYFLFFEGAHRERISSLRVASQLLRPCTMAAHIFCKEEMQSPNATGIIFEVDARAWITCFETFGVIKLQQNQLQADLAELGSWDGGWSAGHFSNPGQGSDFGVQARPAARSPALAASLRWQPHAEGRILMEVWFNRWCLDWSRLWQAFQELLKLNWNILEIIGFHFPKREMPGCQNTTFE